MDAKIHNHLAGLCLNFVKQNLPDDYLILSQLAKDNYSNGFPNYTLGTLLRLFEEIKRKQVATDVL